VISNKSAPKPEFQWVREASYKYIHQYNKCVQLMVHLSTNTYTGKDGFPHDKYQWFSHVYIDDVWVRGVTGSTKADINIEGKGQQGCRTPEDAMARCEKWFKKNICQPEAGAVVKA
jgi:hypothetical protein